MSIMGALDQAHTREEFCTATDTLPNDKDLGSYEISAEVTKPSFCHLHELLCLF